VLSAHCFLSTRTLHPLLLPPLTLITHTPPCHLSTLLPRHIATHLSTLLSAPRHLATHLSTFSHRHLFQTRFSFFFYLVHLCTLCDCK